MDFESGAGVVITLQVADWGDTTPPGEMLEVARQAGKFQSSVIAVMFC